MRTVVLIIFALFGFLYFVGHQASIQFHNGWIDRVISGQDHTIVYTAHWPEHSGKLSAINEPLKLLVTNQLAEGITMARHAYQDWLAHQSAAWRQSRMHISFEICNAESTLVSILFTAFLDVAGTAHPSVWHFAINYDLINKKEILLSDIFSHDPHYLKQLSGACYDALSYQIAKGVLPAFIEINRQGLAPLEQNFSVFTLSPGLITFHFAQYQVAPYSLMPSVNIEQSFKLLMES